MDASTATELVDLSARLGFPASPEARASALAQQTEQVTRALRDFGRHGGERVAVVGLRAGPVATALLGILDRSVLQVTVAGSEPLEPVAPPHWERIAIAVGSEPLAVWVQERFKGAGIPVKGAVVDGIVTRAAGRAEDVLALSAEVFRIAAGKKRAKAGHVDRALDRLVSRSDAVLQRVWETLSPLQQNLLRALAAGERQLFAAETRRAFGLRSTASVARTLELLGEKGLVERRPEGTYAFENPWTRRWVERRALPDVGIRVGSE